MIEIAEVPGNVVVARITGTLSKEHVEALILEVEEKLDRYEQLGVLADITDMEGVSPGAVAKDIAYQIRLIGNWHRFPKAALVAEEGFLAGLSESVGSLLPQIEMRSYAPWAIKEAIAFVSEVPAEPRVH